MIRRPHRITFRMSSAEMTAFVDGRSAAGGARLDVSEHIRLAIKLYLSHAVDGYIRTTVPAVSDGDRRQTKTSAEKKRRKKTV